MVRTQYVCEHVQQQKDMLLSLIIPVLFTHVSSPVLLPWRWQRSAKSLLVTVFLLLNRISAILDIKTLNLFSHDQKSKTTLKFHFSSSI